MRGSRGPFLGVRGINLFAGGPRVFKGVNGVRIEFFRPPNPFKSAHGCDLYLNEITIINYIYACS